MKAFLDLDGVLADFVGGVCKFYGFADPYNNPAFHGKWDFIKLLGFNQKEFWKPLGREFWANLDPTEDFQDILQIVESTFGKTNICILTAPCPSDGCLDGKRDWIRKYLPDYRNRYLMGVSKEFCAVGGQWLIDDADHNVQAFKANGGRTCLVPRIWNSLKYVPTLDHLMYNLPYSKSPFRVGKDN